MTALAVLATLTRRGVLVRLDDDAVVAGPRHLLTDDDRTAIRHHRAALVVLLGGSDATGRRWSQPVGPAHGWRGECALCLALAAITSRAIPCGACWAAVVDARTSQQAGQPLRWAS